MTKEFKAIKPGLNVEYTFVSNTKRNTYRWFGEYDDNGRLKLYDVINGYYLFLTEKRFSFLVKNALESQKSVAPTFTPEEQIKMTLPASDVKGGGVCNS